MERVNYYLTDYQIAELKKLSKEKDMTVSELIRRAVDEYLKRSAKGSK